MYDKNTHRRRVMKTLISAVLIAAIIVLIHAIAYWIAINLPWLGVFGTVTILGFMLVAAYNGLIGEKDDLS